MNRAIYLTYYQTLYQTCYHTFYHTLCQIFRHTLCHTLRHTLRRRQQHLLIAVALTIVTADRLSATEVTEQPGKVLLSDGQYEQALESFVAKRDRGEHTDANKYNLGVTLYRMGRLDEAKVYFVELTESPAWAGLAYYNLGLIAQQTSSGGASDLFTLASQLSGNEQVVRLAQEKINDTRFASVDRQAPGNWLALLRVQGGEDSNAAGLTDEIFLSNFLSNPLLNRGTDNYIEALGYTQAYLRGRHGDGTKLYGLIFSRAFEQLKIVDARIFGAGAAHERPIRLYDTTAGIKALHLQVGDDKLANQVQLDFQLARAFDTTRVTVAWLPSRFFAGDRYSQVEGWQHRLEFRTVRATSPVTLRARYRYELNDRADLARAGSFSSYSPTRHNLKAGLGWEISRKITLDLDAEYQYSDYSGVNQLRDVSGEVRTASRLNKRTQYALSLDYRIRPSLKLSLGFDYTDSDDNFDLYTYDKSRTYLALQYTASGQ